MRKIFKIKMLAYRGRSDVPEIVTMTFEGARTLDAEAVEYWRMAVSKFYGKARVALEDDGIPRNGKK